MWHRVADSDEVHEGTAKTVVAGGRLIALTRVDGQVGALDNACPHKGGPLGQGAIENGLLICPWHAREYHPRTGQCEGYEENVASYPVELRDDGIYVEIGE